MVKVVRFHEAGGPEVLRIEDLPPRDPGPGEVRVRIRFSGINPSDCNRRRGTRDRSARREW